MKRLFAVALMIAGIGGMVALTWPEPSVVAEAGDDAAVNAKVDARLHAILGGMLNAERDAHVVHVHPEMAEVHFGHQ